MQLTSPYMHPLTERTSATSATATLSPWDQTTLAVLKALDSSLLSPGRIESVRSLNGRRFIWSATSILTADDQLVVIPDDVTHPAAGRWLALSGQVVDLEFAITFETADGATLYTLPTGANLMVLRGYWEVTTAFTGGSSSAIGLDSDQSPHDTAGDLLGGAAGDVEATLAVADYIEGTVGADQAAGIILKAGKLVRFQRITDAFTAGVGKAHLVCVLLSNAGV